MKDELVESGPAPVVVEFHSSSTKGGLEAYRVTATSAATEEDVRRTVEHAALARRLALAELQEGGDDGNA